MALGFDFVMALGRDLQRKGNWNGSQKGNGPKVIRLGTGTLGLGLVAVLIGDRSDSEGKRQSRGWGRRLFIRLALKFNLESEPNLIGNSEGNGDLGRKGNPIRSQR